ncbi:hypothetical protein CLV51_11016 [Chitinophaga niastensis]|uniref:DUF1566 domain-containing protein n=1 Tax=Chitinophaga niastensis TaxID=536980 RepID=A0A2P8H9E0_CHINA|nr:hypothetical protein [Chitinophaga niastensis]PSL42800.1 hypothetical protein CLV51_11016 [Chitinophaga niastensis]
MKKLLFLLLFTPSLIFAQKRQVVIDPAGNHGLVIYDSIMQGLTRQEAYRISESNATEGWRLPTPKELKAIFELTLDPQRSYGIIPSGYYYSSSYEVDPMSKDTVPHVGRMYGTFALTYGDAYDSFGGKNFYSLFLVKPF